MVRLTIISDEGAAVANEEHVKILKRGVAEWNAWRKEEKGTGDLTGANLSGAYLVFANLSGTDLTGANLSSANLSHAYLFSADLTAANLTGADLSYADLSAVDLTGANLSNTNLTAADLSSVSLTGANLNNANLGSADLTGADLTSANLTGADLGGLNLIGTDLTRVNLTGARLFNTVFAAVDLSSVVGLETCQHGWQSMIDYQTLQKSGSLPLTFLRGLGLPEPLIEHLPSLLNQAIQFYSCFISYSSKDQDFADRLHTDLQDKGVRCWFAPHDMPIGGKIRVEIDTAIHLRDKVLLILSEDSIKSYWVEDEVEKGFAKERKRGDTVLFPVRVDDAVMETNEAWAVKLRDQRHIGDFRHWKDNDGYKRSFERVLRDLTLSTAGDKQPT
jgi:uncharacterized protein YjbI with pentapeptide repeats